MYPKLRIQLIKHISSLRSLGRRRRQTFVADDVELLRTDVSPHHPPSHMFPWILAAPPPFLRRKKITGLEYLGAKHHRTSVDIDCMQVKFRGLDELDAYFSLPYAPFYSGA
jgi:hypothetical protein